MRILKIKNIMIGFVILIIIDVCVNFVLIYNYWQSKSDFKCSYFCLINAIFELIRWSFCVKIGLINIYDVNNYEFRNYTNENEDWELLNNDIFISRKFSYYFRSDNLVSTIILTKEFTLPYLTCLVQVFTDKNHEKSFFVKPNFEYLHSSGHIAAYKLECPLEGLINVRKENSQKFKLYMIHKYSFLYLVTVSHERTKRAINLEIISKNRLSNERKSAICGPMLYLDSKSYENFKYWLEINIKIGYQKIVLNIISLENKAKFYRLFDKYKDVVDIKPYEFIPDLYYLKNNKTSPYIKPEEYANRSKKNRLQFVFDHDDSHLTQHRAVINGCFLSLSKNYNLISVIDNDEIIFPNSGTIKYLFDDETNIVINNLAESVATQLNEVKCAYNMNKYIENLNKIYLNTYESTNISMWLHYSHHLEPNFVHNMFNHFKAKVITMREFNGNFSIFLQDKRNISISVQNEGDFIYLKNLVNFYDQIYLNGKSLNKLETNINKRIWIIQESRRKELGWGKVCTFYIY